MQGIAFLDLGPAIKKDVCVSSAMLSFTAKSGHLKPQNTANFSAI